MRVSQARPNRQHYSIRTHKSHSNICTRFTLLQNHLIYRTRARAHTLAAPRPNRQRSRCQRKKKERIPFRELYLHRAVTLFVYSDFFVSVRLIPLNERAGLCHHRTWAHCYWWQMDNIAMESNAKRIWCKESSTEQAFKSTRIINYNKVSF